MLYHWVIRESWFTKSSFLYYHICIICHMVLHVHVHPLNFAFDSSKIKVAVSRQSSSILFNFANYWPSIAMELEVSKEITCKWQNQRSETNKYVSWALFLKLQAAGINFEKLLGWTLFKNPNFNPFQSSSVFPFRGICCFCYVVLTFL